MQELKHFKEEQRKQIKYVLMDIDDTLTLEGKLPAVAYGALEKLQESGIKVIPVTGRPAGWCDHIARMWPVDCVIGENGAFYFYYSKEENRIIHRYYTAVFQKEYESGESANRKCNLNKLINIGLTVCEKYNSKNDKEKIHISNDQFYRETDVAVDFAEDVPYKLDLEKTQEVYRMIVEEGERQRGDETLPFVAKISSIHINAWYGDYNKVKMARLMFKNLFDSDFDDIKQQVVFAGDSPNDAPMFAEVPNAVGVANVMKYMDILEAKPAWITSKPGGFGFAELADLITV